MKTSHVARPTYIVVAALFVLFNIGCGEIQAQDAGKDQTSDAAATPDAPTSTPATCVPGEQNICLCLDGRQSYQVCADDGKSFDACHCDECMPGLQHECFCPGGLTGMQACADDGKSYNKCKCNQPDAGAQPDANVESDAQPDSNTEPDAEADANVEPDAQVEPPTLNVKLSLDTPPGMTMCDGAQTSVLKFGYENSSSEPITVASTKLHRVGIGSINDFTVGGIAGDYTHLGIPDLSGYLEFNNMVLTVPAMTSMEHSYWVGVTAPGGVSGDQFAFEIEKPSDITLDGSAKVAGSFPVRGNTFVISNVKCGELKASLASNPVSNTVVTKAHHIETVGITLYASGANDMKVTYLPLQCQASIHGAPYAAVDCDKRITSLAYYDGDTMVGLPWSPDANGIAPIAPNVVVPVGTIKTLTVKASFASTASDTPPYDRVSIGLAPGGVATDMVYNQTVGIDVGNSLAAQLSQNPIVTTTIMPSGTISITEDNMPPAQTVVAGNGNWVPFAGLKATTQYEDGAMDVVRVCNTNGGDNADFEQIAVAMGGAVQGTAILPAGATGCVDVFLTNNVIIPEKDGLHFDVWAKLRPVYASYEVAGAWIGVARSGHAPALGLARNYQTGNWDAAYNDKVNVRITGKVSGERMYADNAGGLDGSRMVIRKSKPYIAPLPLANNVLQNGTTEQEVSRLQISADGEVGFKQLPLFTFDHSDGVTNVSFNLFRGATPVPLNEYTVTEVSTGLNANSVPITQNPAILAVAFFNEETIVGSGYVYSLRAVKTVSGNGQHIGTSFYYDAANCAFDYTGWVKNNDPFVPPVMVSSPTIYNVADYTGCNNGGKCSHALGLAVWTDKSEAGLHSPLTIENGGSRDAIPCVDTLPQMYQALTN
ncbi:MAG: hypothetical protein PHS79_04595 [Patescibacteria group bacterium]|nr:hypothetical protein [Patescibacteria group bacterium]